jgi:hypoxanthine-DNA glycosylase
MSIKTSFAPVVKPDIKVLVLGSLPGDRSLAEGRYYAHPQNQFWKLMSGVVGVDLPTLDYEARLDALLGAGVGLWDVVGTASRAGSTDAAIRDISANDLRSLIHSLPSLRAIGFNGGTALSIGQRQMGASDGSPALVALPSSSALHTIGLAAKQPAWDALRNYLG